MASGDIFIACVGGLKGFPEAIRAVYPKTEVQLCIVHMIRNSLKYVSFKDRKKIASDLKEIYRAATVEVAEKALETFSATWEISYHQPVLEKQLGEHHSFLCIFPGNKKGDLYNQRNRIPEYVSEESSENESFFSE